MNLDGLSPELQGKLCQCQTPEEVLALAREEGYVLSDDELEAVSGGWSICDDCRQPPRLRQGK